MAEEDSDFIKNIDEEKSDEGDEIENQINDKMEQYKKTQDKDNSRPESKHTRPESSKYVYQKNGRPNQDSINYQESSEKKLNFKEIEKDYYGNNGDQNQSGDEEQDDQDNQNEILVKFDRYVTFNSINIEDFWLSNKVFVKKEEFKSYLGPINFIVQGDEFDLLTKDLINQDGFITIEKLCQKVESWKNNADFMIEFIKDKALKLAQESKKKLASAKNLQSSQGSGGLRPYSSSAYSGGRPISGISTKSYKSKISGMSNLQLSTVGGGNQQVTENRSKHFLKKAKEKDQEVERMLMLTINRSKNEQEYECLIKMGEANELSQQLQSKLTYRAYKSADGSLKVHVYELDKFVKEQSLEEFQREYNQIRNQYNQSKKLQFWERSTDNKKHGFGSKEKIGQDDNDGGGKNVSKQDRQSELKHVLLQTMMLTNILKEQLAVLKKNKINGNQQTANGKPSFSHTNTFMH